MGNLLGSLADHYDAVVVGIGPVGALTANLIGRERLRTLAVDQAPIHYNLPRALGIDHESLRLMQSIGVADAIAPHVGAYRTSEYRAASGAVLRRIVQPPEPHPLSWPPYATFLQPELEAAARQAMAECPAITVSLGLRARLAGWDGDAVRLSLDDPATGKGREITCQFLLACDGASSSMREQLGIRLEDLEFDEPWLVVDVLLDEVSHLPEVNIQNCDPARPSTYICGPGQLRRWEVMILPGENPAELVKEDTIRRLLLPWLKPGEGRIWRAATYRFHALVAERWRQGNVFLLGDAAHQTPPFMAQGLNQGLRDAGNLCWKIGEVFHGRAAPAHLDSYEAERRPATEHAIKMAKTLGRIICERDPAIALARDKAMLAEMDAGQGTVVRQDLLMQSFEHGFVLRDASGHPSVGAGRMFPQPWVRAGGRRVRMDDALGARWLLVCRAGWVPDAASLERARVMEVKLAQLGSAVPPFCSIDEESGLIAAWMAGQDAAAVLVRPDHAVFGCAGGDTPEATLLRALEQTLAKTFEARSAA